MPLAIVTHSVSFHTVSRYDGISLNDNSGQRLLIRRNAIQGDQSSDRNRYTATGLALLVSRRSIAKVMRPDRPAYAPIPPHPCATRPSIFGYALNTP
jgi:hypothetical protein